MERRQTAKVTEALTRLNAYLDEHEAKGTAPKSLSIAARETGIAYSSLMNSSGYVPVQDRARALIEAYKDRMKEADRLRFQAARIESQSQRNALLASIEYFKEAGIKPESLKEITRHAGLKYTAAFYVTGNEDIRQAAREICPARPKKKKEEPTEPTEDSPEDSPEDVLLALRRERWGDCLSTRGGIKAFPLVRAH